MSYSIGVKSLPTLSIIIVFCILGFIPNIIYSQEQGLLPSVRIMPDNPIYFLKLWWEKIRTVLTFNLENKTSRNFYLAEVRLSEYQRMLELKNGDAARDVLVKYESQLNKAIDGLDALSAEGGDVQVLYERASEIVSRHIEILTNDLEAPDQQSQSDIKRVIAAAEKWLKKDIIKSSAVINITELNNSGEYGILTLGAEGESTVLSIDLAGAPTNLSQPVYIHFGSCESLGAIKYPLASLVGGKLKTTLNVPIYQLKFEAPLAINVHKSAAEAKVYVACGDLAF